uniref:Secreted protein n=1 Tax=Rhipicephalus zambeziensis TaxID=60191 RepID=A0A224YR85_9ACAR
MKPYILVNAITIVVFGFLLSPRENGAPSTALALPFPAPIPQLRVSPSAMTRRRSGHSPSAQNKPKNIQRQDASKRFKKRMVKAAGGHKPYQTHYTR